MTETHNPMPLNDVLYAFALDERELSAEVLDDFIYKYPEHAHALTDLAIELAVDSLRMDAVVESEAVVDAAQCSPAVSRAMSRFQNRLYSAKRLTSEAATKAAPDAAGVVNPFASLDRRAFRELAEQLQSNTVFVGKLRDRQIEPATIPQGLMRRVAELLMIPVEWVVAHFAAPMGSQPRLQLLKADQKPVVVLRQNYEDAVRSSDLTEQQERYLLSL